MLANFCLKPIKLRDIFHLLSWEAAFAVVFETWVGPSYLSGLAGELGVPLFFVSILAAIPCIGSAGQILGAWIFERWGSTKSFVLWAGGVGRALWLVPLSSALYWGMCCHRDQVSFPVVKWFTITAICASISSLLTSASSNAWMYWMKTLLPNQIQGRFFGVRQRSTTSAFIAASVAAYSALKWAPHGYRLGAVLLCVLALISGGVSVYLLSFVQRSHCDQKKKETPQTFKMILQSPLKNREFRDFLFFGAMFNGAIQLSSSYFPYYFTKELNIPMGTVALWTGITNLGCFAAAKFWGKRIDRVNSPFEILGLTGHVVAFAPLFYFLIQDRALIQSLAPIEYFVSGLAWSGFVLAQTKLLLKLSPPKEAAAYFSVYTTVCGISGALCTFLGGQLAVLLAPWGGFRLLWLIGASFRLLVLWGSYNPLPQIQRVTTALSARFQEYLRA